MFPPFMRDWCEPKLSRSFFFKEMSNAHVHLVGCPKCGTVPSNGAVFQSNTGVGSWVGPATAVNCRELIRCELVTWIFSLVFLQQWAKNLLWRQSLHDPWIQATQTGTCHSSGSARFDRQLHFLPNTEDCNYTEKVDLSWSCSTWNYCFSEETGTTSNLISFNMLSISTTLSWSLANIKARGVLS